MTFQPFSSQPAELFESVCAFVEQPRDLLSFALTCKRACHAIIPDHIELRHIRCDFLRESLWEILANSPAVASRITSLEIIDESRLVNAIVPTHVAQFADGLELSTAPLSTSLIMPPDFTSQMQALSNAIKSMVNLGRFAWATDVISPDRVVEELKSCEKLDDIHIFYWDRVSPQPAISNIGASQLWDLSNLRRFSFTTGNLRLPSDFHAAYNMRMLDMLQHCPNLEDLHIPRNHGLTLFFSHGLWPHLKRLSFGYGDILPGEENDTGIQRFLNTHTTLERLCLPDHSQATWSVSGLPNLKALDAGMHLDLSSVVPDVTVGKKLEFLSCVNFTTSSRCCCPGGSLAFLQRVPNLRAMNVFCSKPSNELLVSIADAVPRLERLHFERWTFMDAISAQSIKLGIFAKRVEFVSRLPRLTHLSQFVALNILEPDDTWLIGLVMEGFASASKSLKFVEVRWTRAKWVTILRDDGKYKGWCYTTASDLENVRAGGWGELYRGITGIPEQQWSS